jgi:hypothetical protein
MSAYHLQQTQYKDRDCLVAALNDMGYKTVEVHDIAQQLYDFQGRATHYLDSTGDRANVIVRRHVVGGAANDLGFALQPDGTYSAIISEFDNYRHNADWLKALKRSYVEKVDMKLAKAHGLRFLGRKVINGRVQLQYLDSRGN